MVGHVAFFLLYASIEYLATRFMNSDQTSAGSRLSMMASQVFATLVLITTSERDPSNHSQLPNIVFIFAT